MKEGRSVAMGTGMALAIIMACLAILVVAKTRAPADDDAAMLVYTRNQMLGTEARSGAWAFVVILFVILFLALAMAG